MAVVHGNQRREREGEKVYTHIKGQNEKIKTIEQNIYLSGITRRSSVYKTQEEERKNKEEDFFFLSS
jgi:hypothetical protein